MARVTNSRDWHDLTPALGMILGGALGLLVAVVVPDAVDALGIAIVVGATLGLVLGSIAWVLQRHD